MILLNTFGDFVSKNLTWILVTVVFIALTAAVVVLFLDLRKCKKKCEEYSYRLHVKDDASTANYQTCVTALCNLYCILEIDGYSKNTARPMQVDINKIYAAVESLANFKNRYIKTCDTKPSSNEVVGILSPKTTTKKDKPTAARILYASFPRSVDGLVYFADVSESKNEESHFELCVAEDGKKAAFKPTDFMKIRNVDEAMNGIVIEGVRANLAHAVVGIESGKAHRDGKDWIIDEQAIVKLS